MFYAITKKKITKSRRFSVTSRIKWEVLEDKDVRKQFASSMALKFRQLQKVSEGIAKEWSFFRTAMISSHVDSCGQKRLRMASGSEKRTFWWKKNVKQAIRAKIDRCF